MEKFFFTKFKFKKKHMYLSILLSFFIIAYYHLSSGFVMTSDSNKYSIWADGLINYNFNLYQYYFVNEVVPNRVPPILYTVPVLLIAIFKIIFGNEWQYVFLLQNLVFLLFSLIIFAKSLLLIGVRPFLVSITLPIIIISADILTWPRYILSDINFAFLVVLVTYFVIKGTTEGKFNYSALFLIIFLMFVSRPSSIPVIFAISLFILISKYQIFPRPKIALLFMLGALISIPFVFSIIYFIFGFYLSENVKLEYLFNMVKVGMIIHDRPETWVDAPNNFIDVLFVYFFIIINFFNPYAITFSLTHNVLNIFQSFLIFLSILIWAKFGDNKKPQDRAFFFIILLSFSVAAFHSFTLIDYDWRFRFPIILPLIMLSPISMEIILKKILTRINI